MKKPAMDLSGSEDEDFAPRKPAKKPMKKPAMDLSGSEDEDFAPRKPAK